MKIEPNYNIKDYKERLEDLLKRKEEALGRIEHHNSILVTRASVRRALEVVNYELISPEDINNFLMELGL